MKIRFRTSKKGMECVPMPSNREAHGAVSASPDIRRKVRNRTLLKVRLIRESQNQDKGMVDLPFELINQSSGEVIKKSYMTDSEAILRNNSIRDVGMAWRRCGY
jgi:hypothetical protein